MAHPEESMIPRIRVRKTRRKCIRKPRQKTYVYATKTTSKQKDINKWYKQDLERFTDAIRWWLQGLRTKSTLNSLRMTQMDELPDIKSPPALKIKDLFLGVPRRGNPCNPVAKILPQVYLAHCSRRIRSTIGLRQYEVSLPFHQRRGFTGNGGQRSQESYP